MIKITDLNKSFSNKVVLNNLNLEIPSNKITVLVGKNGSGKSTLIRLICGLLKMDSGLIEISQNSSIGILLGGDVNLYGNLNGHETLRFFAQLHNLSASQLTKTIDKLNDVLDFKHFLDKKVFSLSRGMRQKLALTISIIHNPNILLLDEPSTGLDIESSNDVINFLKYLKTEHKTIFIATHNIFEISDLSDDIAFLANGKITQKVSTNDFFLNCTPDSKNQILIQAMEAGEK